MAVNLGTVEIGVRLSTKELDRQLKALEGIKLSNTPLKPIVDHKELEKLNKHLDLKIRHHQQAQRYFDAKPLTVAVDTRQLDSAFKKLQEFESLSRKVNVKAPSPAVQRSGSTVNVEMQTRGIEKAIETSIEKATEKAVVKLGNALYKSVIDGFTQQSKKKDQGNPFTKLFKTIFLDPLAEIKTGFFEGVGDRIALEITSGALSQKSRTNLRKTGKAVGDYITDRAPRVGEAVSRNIGYYGGLEEVAQDLQFIGKALDSFIDPDKFGNKLKNFEDKLVEILESIFVFKDLSVDELQDQLFELFSPAIVTGRSAATRAAGVATRAAFQPLRIRKRVNLAQSMQLAEQLAESIELTPEQIEEINQAQSVSFVSGGLDLNKGANTETAAAALDPLLQGSYVVPNINAFQNSKEIASSFTKLRRFIFELLPENLKKELLEGAKNLENNQGLELLEVIPMDKLLQSAIDIGFSPDSIKQVAMAMAIRKQFPDKPIQFLGTSGGSAIAEESVAIAQRAGIDAKGMGAMFPGMGLAPTASPEDFQYVIGEIDPFTLMFFGGQYSGNQRSDAALYQANALKKSKQKRLDRLRSSPDANPRLIERLEQDVKDLEKLETELLMEKFGDPIKEITQELEKLEAIQGPTPKTQERIAELKKLLKEAKLAQKVQVGSFREAVLNTDLPLPIGLLAASQNTNFIKGAGGFQHSIPSTITDPLFAEIFNKLFEGVLPPMTEDLMGKQGRENVNFMTGIKTPKPGEMGTPAEPMIRSIKAALGDPEALAEIARGYYSFVDPSHKDWRRDGDFRQSRAYKERQTVINKLTGSAKEKAQEYSDILEEFNQGLIEYFESNGEQVERLRNLLPRAEKFLELNKLAFALDPQLVALNPQLAKEFEQANQMLTQQGLPPLDMLKSLFAGYNQAGGAVFTEGDREVSVTLPEDVISQLPEALKEVLKLIFPDLGRTITEGIDIQRQLGGELAPELLGVSPDLTAIAQQKVRGNESLFSLLSTNYPYLPMENRQDLIRQVGAMMRQLQNRGVISNAIDPNNLFMTEQGLRLADFQQARRLSSNPEEAARQQAEEMQQAIARISAAVAPHISPEEVEQLLREGYESVQEAVDNIVGGLEETVDGISGAVEAVVEQPAANTPQQISDLLSTFNNLLQSPREQLGDIGRQLNQTISSPFKEAPADVLRRILRNRLNVQGINKLAKDVGVPAGTVRQLGKNDLVNYIISTLGEPGREIQDIVRIIGQFGDNFKLKEFKGQDVLKRLSPQELEMKISEAIAALTSSFTDEAMSVFEGVAPQFRQLVTEAFSGADLDLSDEGVEQKLREISQSLNDLLIQQLNGGIDNANDQVNAINVDSPTEGVMRRIFRNPDGAQEAPNLPQEDGGYFFLGATASMANLKRALRRLLILRQAALDELSKQGALGEALATPLDEPIKNLIEQINQLGQDTQGDPILERFDLIGNAISGFFDKIEEAVPLFGRVRTIIESLVKGFISFQAIKTATELMAQLGTITASTAIEFQRLGAVIGFAIGGDGVKKIKELADSAQELGVSLKESIQGYAQFAAATKGTSIEPLTDQIFRGFSEAIAVRGLDPSQADRIFTALSQIASKGRVSLEELSQQLNEALPGALQSAARAMGVTTNELLKLVSAGEVMAEDLLPKLSEQLSREASASLGSSGSTLQAELNRLNNQMLELQNNIGQGFVDIASMVMPIVNGALTLIIDNFDALRLLLEVLAAKVILSLVKSLYSLGVALGILPPTFKELIVNLGKFSLAMLRATINIENLKIALRGLFAQFGPYVLAILAIETAFRSFALTSNEVTKAADRIEKATKKIRDSLDKTAEVSKKKGLYSIDKGNSTDDPFLRFLDDLVIRGLDPLDKINNIFDSAIGNRPLPQVSDFASFSRFQAGVIFGAAKEGAEQIREAVDLVNNALSGAQVVNPSTGKSAVQQLGEIEQVINSLQNQRLLADTKGDIDEVQRLNEEIKKQQELRQQLLEAQFGDAEALRGQIEELKGIRESIEQRRPLLERFFGKDKVQELLGQIDKDINAAEQAMGEFEKATASTLKPFRELAYLASKVAATLENLKYVAQAVGNIDRKTILGFQATGQISGEQAQGALRGVDYRERQAELDALNKSTLEYINLVNRLSGTAKNDIVQLLELPEPNLELANLGDVNRVLETMGDQITAEAKKGLELIKTVREQQLEASNLEVELVQAQVDFRSRFDDFRSKIDQAALDAQDNLIDLQRGYEDLMRELANRTADILDSLAKIINDINILDIKNSLRQALTPGIDSIASSFVDLFTNLIDQLGQVANQRIDLRGRGRQIEADAINYNRQVQDQKRQVERFNFQRAAEQRQLIREYLGLEAEAGGLGLPGFSPDLRLQSPESSVKPEDFQSLADSIRQLQSSTDSLTQSNIMLGKDGILLKQQGTATEKQTVFNNINAKLQQLEAEATAVKQAYDNTDRQASQRSKGDSLLDYATGKAYDPSKFYGVIPNVSPPDLMEQTDNLFAETYRLQTQRSQRLKEIVKEARTLKDLFASFKDGTVGFEETMQFLDNLQLEFDLNTPELQQQLAEVDNLIKLQAQELAAQLELTNKQVADAFLNFVNSAATELVRLEDQIRQLGFTLRGFKENLDGLSFEFSLPTRNQKNAKELTDASRQFRSIREEIQQQRLELSRLLENDDLLQPGAFEAFISKLQNIEGLDEQTTSELTSIVTQYQQGFLSKADAYNSVVEQLNKLESEATYREARALDFLRARQQQQDKIDTDRFINETLAAEFRALAEAPGFIDLERSALNAEARLLEFFAELPQRTKEFQEQLRELGLEGTEMGDRLTEAFNKVNQVELKSIQDEANALATSIREGLLTSLDDAIGQFFKAETTLLESLRNFAVSFLKIIADMAAKVLAQSVVNGIFELFGGNNLPAAAPVPNFADGGMVEESMNKERAASGKKPVLAVLHEGEHVLSTKNGDAQYFRALEKSGAWDDIKKQSSVPNFAKGGAVGGGFKFGDTLASLGIGLLTSLLLGVINKKKKPKNEERQPRNSEDNGPLYSSPIGLSEALYPLPGTKESPFFDKVKPLNYSIKPQKQPEVKPFKEAEYSRYWKRMQKSSNVNINELPSFPSNDNKLANNSGRYRTVNTQTPSIIMNVNAKDVNSFNYSSDQVNARLAETLRRSQARNS